MPSSAAPSAPLARSRPMASSIATRYGMMPTAIWKPSFAPSMKTSYTFTRRNRALSRNTTIKPNSKPLLNTADCRCISAAGRLPKYSAMPATSAVTPPR